MKEAAKSLKGLMISNFENNMVFERTPKEILSLLNTPVHKSAKMRVFPEVDDVEVKNIDTLHDEVTLLWSDLKVKGVMTWAESNTDDKRKAYRLVGYE